MPRKIGFLFNHDEVHQVAHTAPVITNILKLFPAIEILAMASSQAQVEHFRRIVSTGESTQLKIRKLETPFLLKQAFACLNHLAPVQRLYILGRYRSLFESLDCLVVAEFTSTRLKSHYGITSTPLVLLPHGAGDRSIGFSREIRYFDHVLLSGAKVRDRMMKQGLIRPGNYSLVGYPKFDTINFRELGHRKFFANDNPVVLYNPHFDAHLSSWYKLGLDVLEYFYRRKDYNLIVAPHVMLYSKKIHYSLKAHKLAISRAIPPMYQHSSNIRIDLGSNDCVNMAYTINADIYLGDVSSQVYEYLLVPRPCIFLNAHGAKWQNNPDYQHWNFGPVLDDVGGLDAILGNLEALQNEYRGIQARSFSETFDLQGTSSSLRAAQSIMRFLDSRAAALA